MDGSITAPVPKSAGEKSYMEQKNIRQLSRNIFQSFNIQRKSEVQE